ncbi:gag-pol poly protein, partial [Lasius niger]
MLKYLSKENSKYILGALDVIDGKLVKPKPLAEGATNAQIKTHKECSDCYRKANSYAKSIITSAITDEVYQKIMNKETASEAWEALKQQFEATSKDQLFKICTEFLSFRRKS